MVRAAAAVHGDWLFVRAELREGTLAGCRLFFEWLTPPVQLLVCGAGTDAEPVVLQAAALGWSVVVLDQRADFARDRDSRGGRRDRGEGCCGVEGCGSMRGRPRS